MSPFLFPPPSPHEPDPQTDMPCSFAWSRAPSTAESSRREGKRIAHPLQQSWATGAINISEKSGSLPVDVHLYVRGGDWIEQFANKLVGEAGGNRHLSSIYVSGSLRKRGETQLRAKLEAKGWTLPAEWHSEEWVLWQRHGKQIVIKLAYAKAAALEGLSVRLEASLSDPDVWWSLPVYVDTGREPVFGIRVDAGIFCPAIAGQEIAVGVANRGGECYAVMPIVDGYNMLKAPYLIWPGDKQRNWDEGGAAFASFPGLQTTFVSARRERVDASYRPLRFARSKPVTGCPSALSSGQGSVRVRLFNVRKIAFRSDVDEALGQVEDMKGEIAAVPSPTNISPLLLPTDSQTLRHYDTCVATSGADVRHSYECVDVSWEAHSLAGEVVINYRSLAWFREAHVAKQKAAMMQSTPHAVVSSAAPPDSISPPAPSPSPSPPPTTLTHPLLPRPSPPPLPRSSEKRTGGAERAHSSSSGGGNVHTRYTSPRRASVSSGQRTPPTAAMSPSRSPSSPYIPSSRTTGLPLSPAGMVTASVGEEGGKRRMRDLSPSQRLLQPSPRQARAAQHQLPTFRDLLRNSSPTKTTRPTPTKGRVTPVGPNLRTANRMREKMGDAARSGDGAPKVMAKASQEAVAGRGEKTRLRWTSSSSSATSTLSGESDVVWVVPDVRGKTFRKDEVEVRMGTRNIANLRRQVKADLAPLFDDWSTAELDVMVGGVVLTPETLLSSLPKGAGSAGDPFVVRAMEKGQAVLGEVGMEGGEREGNTTTESKGEREAVEGGGDASGTSEEEVVGSGQVEEIKGREEESVELEGDDKEVAHSVEIDGEGEETRASGRGNDVAEVV